MPSPFPPPVKSFDGNWSNYQALIDEVYRDFSQQFLENQATFNGKPITVDFTEQADGKSPDFWHIVTRNAEDAPIRAVPHKNNPRAGRNDYREANLERAIRAHWVLPLIQNYQHADMSCFAYKEGSGRVNHYFWHRPSNYLVILVAKVSCFRLVTAFVVDKKYMLEDLERKLNNAFVE